jgi:hypothetical protein
VKVSVETAVTLTISAFVLVACSPAGQIVAMNGGSGKRAPSPLATTREVPYLEGTGAVATVEYAKFLC